MADKYTPRTEDVKARHALATVNDTDFPGWEKYKAEQDAQFERWLAGHDDEIREAVVAEVVELLHSQVGDHRLRGAARLVATMIQWWHDARTSGALDGGGSGPDRGGRK